MTTPEHYDDIAAAFALDAVDAIERRDIARLAAHDVELRREIDEYRAVAAILAEAVEDAPSTPSPRVWEGIAASIAGESDAVPPELSSVRSRRRERRVFRMFAAISVAAVMVSAVLSVALVRMAGDDGDATQIAINELLEAPGSRVVTLVGAEGVAADAKIVLGTDGIGYVFADTLPALATDRTYQLWAVVGEEVISAGVLGHDPARSPFQVVGSVTGFAITEEVAGGVPVSEGTLVAAWSASA